MKKIFLAFALMLSMALSFSSCVTTAYGQDVVIESSDDGIDISIVLSAGVPYYFEGSLLYYLYNGWYYYPYYYNNRVYYYRYARPFATYRGYRFIPERGHRPHGFRELPPPRRGHDTWRNQPPRRSSTYETAPRPRVDNNRPTVTPRTMPQPRQGGNGNFTPRVNTPSRSGGSMTPNRGGGNSHGGFGGSRRR